MRRDVSKHFSALVLGLLYNISKNGDFREPGRVDPDFTVFDVLLFHNRD